MLRTSSAPYGDLLEAPAGVAARCFVRRRWSTWMLFRARPAAVRHWTKS